MASSIEMLTAVIALLIWSFVEYVLYVLGSAILGVIIPIIDTFKITPLLGMSDNTYIFYIYFGFLLVFEIAAIIATGYVVMRKQVSGVDYL